MIQLALCLMLVLLLGAEFGVYGVGLQKPFRLELRGYETWIFGFFVYFGLFQIAALPMVLLQRPFHELVWLWLVVSGLVNLYVLAAAARELMICFKRAFAALWRLRGLLLAAVVLLVLFTCWFQATQQYMGWDTTYYIGTVDTTVYTDSMYVYDGGSGLPEKALNLRYALSSFYMHSALLCRITAVGGVMVQKYVLGTVCILMHGLLMYALGRRLFPEEEKKALFLTGLVFVMHLGFQTVYSVSDFLVIRGYEAKGFCANVVIPAAFYSVVCIWEEHRKREHWALMFISCFSSVPVSMSSIVVVPAMAVVALLAEGIVKKSWNILWRGFWCVVPNGVYLIVYFLYTQGLKIMIHS